MNVDEVHIYFCTWFQCGPTLRCAQIWLTLPFHLHRQPSLRQGLPDYLQQRRTWTDWLQDRRPHGPKARLATLAPCGAPGAAARAPGLQALPHTALWATGLQRSWSIDVSFSQGTNKELLGVVRSDDLGTIWNMAFVTTAVLARSPGAKDGRIHQDTIPVTDDTLPVTLEEEPFGGACWQGWFIHLDIRWVV